MLLYNLTKVDENTKNRILELMADYDASYISGRLGSVYFELLKTRPQDLKSDPEDPFVERHPYHSWQQRFVLAGFLNLLAKEAQLSPPLPRWSNGTKPLQWGELEAQVMAVLEGLDYPIKANTWAAVCEEWLRVRNIDHLKGAKQKGEETGEWERYDPPPDDEEGLIRWDLKYGADMIYFY